jgi:alpha-glucosidase
LVRKAARYHLMVDVHDEYRPTGFSRTYPNFLTQEGVRGNEHMPTARHNVTLPFTRYPAGAADYTPCYYSKGIKTTHAHQLALPGVFYSPAMFLFWYDRPGDFQGEAEIEFWDHLPTVWDDTRVVRGEIGNFVTIARQRGKEWYVGSLTNEEARELEIPLAFEEEGASYLASVYSDAEQDDPTRTHVRLSQRLVDSSTILKAMMAPNGGQAIRIVPKHDG